MNYNALSKLPQADVNLRYSLTTIDGAANMKAVVSNVGNDVALMLRLIALNENGERVLPIWFTDNYISLVPNESKAIDISFDASWLAGKKVNLFIEGWNLNRKAGVLAQP
jgi:hypothetical protein